jgi:hypothetical protein
MMAKYEYADLTVVGWTGSASSPMVVTPIFRVADEDIYLALSYRLFMDDVHAEITYCLDDLKTLQARGQKLSVGEIEFSAKPNHLLWWAGLGARARYEPMKVVLDQLHREAIRAIDTAVLSLDSNPHKACEYCDRATAADESFLDVAEAIKKLANISEEKA